MKQPDIAPFLHRSFTKEAVLDLVERVEEELAKRNVRLRPSSSLMSLFADVRRLNKMPNDVTDEKWRKTFYRANEARRIASAIEIALNEPGSQSLIERIASSDMNSSSKKNSSGRNALWELDLFRRLYLGKVHVRIREPDLMVDLGGGLGDYAIACKKTYSESGVEGALRKGIEQIERSQKPGIVAFNLDSLTADRQWQFKTSTDLGQALSATNRRFIDAHTRTFTKLAGATNCEGVLVSTCQVACVIDALRPIGVVTGTAMWEGGNSNAAQRRFRAFKEHMDRVDAAEA